MLLVVALSTAGSSSSSSSSVAQTLYLNDQHGINNDNLSVCPRRDRGVR
jgi:hypothetical protein